VPGTIFSLTKFMDKYSEKENRKEKKRKEKKNFNTSWVLTNGSQKIIHLRIILHG